MMQLAETFDEYNLIPNTFLQIA